MNTHEISRPRLVIGGTSSGVGKTTFTLGLIRHLRGRGLKVAAFKCGPDYLDPTYHARAAGRPCHNLDGWMMGRDGVIATFLHGSEGADLSIIEGVMGLFDGASPTGEEGSTAEVAKWLGAPVVLVTDASGVARSLAAVALGFRTFDPELAFSGLIANRVGSRGHLELLERAVTGTRVFGGLPKAPELELEERHLGLRTADERVLPERVLEGWAERVAEWCRVDALLEVARGALAVPASSSPCAASPAPAPSTPLAASTPLGRRPASCRIGVAKDSAFHFYYPENLRRLEAAGAELVEFSPISAPALPEVDALYLGGGYPELHAEALAANARLRAEIAAFAEAGRPIYAECGGLMYLTRALRTLEGREFPMVGVFPAVAVMRPKLQALGYVEVETQARSLLGAAGVRFRGHQFRYSELEGMPEDVERSYSLRRRRGSEVSREGYTRGRVLASYVHAHWASNPGIAESFVAAAGGMR